MDEMFLKAHSLEDPPTQNSQLLSQEIKLHESPIQWGYVIDNDSKVDVKLQNYESKPATITVIKIGGIENLSPLNYANSHQIHHEIVLREDQGMLPPPPIPSFLKPTTPAVVCQNCDASFSTKYQFQRHQCEFNASKVVLKSVLPKRQIEKPKTKHECDVCHKSFMNEHNLERHRLSHGDKKPFICPNCGKGFVLESRLNGHLESHCKKVANEAKKFYKTDLSVWRCWNCHLITATEPSHLIHICGNVNPTFFPSKPTTTSQEPVIDPNLITIPSRTGTDSACDDNNFDKNFEKAMDIIDHTEEIVPDCPSITEKHTFRSINVEQLFQCEFCNRTYACKEVLKAHQDSHETDRNYQCMFCAESFDSYTIALIHWQHKCNEKTNVFCLPKTILCKFCDKGFKSHELLYAHKYKLKHFVPKLFNDTEPLVTLQDKMIPLFNNDQVKSDFDLPDSIFANRTELSFKVTSDYGKVTITEISKSSDLSEDSGNCSLSSFEKQIDFSEEEIHQNISPLHGHEPCQNEIAQIDEFLNDIANKVFNKTPEEPTASPSQETLSNDSTKQNEKDNSAAVVENLDEIKIEPVEEAQEVQLPKRGRKPKPKLPESEVTTRCEDGYRFQCEKCAKLTSSIELLIEHRQSDHGSNFECKECGQVVHSAKALMIHCRAHQSLKPFVCDQCGRSYSQTSHLWQHMRFHQGIKPFACPHEGCEARYTIRPDLKDHIRKVHTRERPFRCAVCGKCFLTGSVYYQHRLIHNNDRRYGCDMCGKRFFRADALNNHRRIHTDERPFPCPVCGREFRQKGDRNKHHRTQHPDEILSNNTVVLPQFRVDETLKLNQL